VFLTSSSASRLCPPESGDRLFNIKLPLIRAGGLPLAQLNHKHASGSSSPASSSLLGGLRAAASARYDGPAPVPALPAPALPSYLAQSFDLPRRLPNRGLKPSETQARILRNPWQGRTLSSKPRLREWRTLGLYPYPTAELPAMAVIAITVTTSCTRSTNTDQARSASRDTLLRLPT